MTNAITIQTALLKAALICASKEHARYYLNGVHVDPKGFLISTDGHRFFCGKIDLTDVPAFEGWTIPSDVIKRALAGYKNITIDISPDRCGDVACTPIDAGFPDWRRVIPMDTLSGETAQFNPDYIADMGKIGKALGVTGLTAHIHHDGQNPAGVTFPGIENAFAVLMPMRAHATDGDGIWPERRAIID
jgi:hypothetical protein